MLMKSAHFNERRVNSLLQLRTTRFQCCKIKRVKLAPGRVKSAAMQGKLWDVTKAEVGGNIATTFSEFG